MQRVRGFFVRGVFLLGLSSLAKGEVDFVHEVMPVLRKHCTECHTGTKKKGGLSLMDVAGSMADVVGAGPSISIQLACGLDTEDLPGGSMRDRRP